MFNKRGQIAETSTWVVATLIIIVLLSISLYGASVLGKSKSVDYYSDSVFSIGYSRTNDLVMESSILAYFSLKDSELKSNLYSKLKAMDEQDLFHQDFDSNFKKVEIVTNE